jgi:tetratricopeptide (TPR) repeat protein
VHERDEFLLVQSHTNLGECYLNYEYYEQSLEHLISALKMNGTLFSKLEESKAYHPHILTLLGRCYLEAGSVDESTGLLDKALTMNQGFYGEDNISNSPIL